MWNDKMWVISCSVLTSLLLFASCERIVEPGAEGSASVICHLEAGNSVQTVRLYRTAPVSEHDSIPLTPGAAGDFFFKYFLDQADVRVRDGFGTEHSFGLRIDSTVIHQYWPVPTDTYALSKAFVSPASMIVRPNEAYLLSIHTSSGDITGQTIVPADFTLRSPEGTVGVTTAEMAAGIPITWRRSPNAYGYLVTFSTVSWHPSPWGMLVPWRGERVTETTDTSSVFMHPVDIVPPDTVDIAVVAYDENYYNYRHRGVPSSDLKGGYGCFSSGVRKTARLVLN